MSQRFHLFLTRSMAPSSGLQAGVKAPLSVNPEQATALKAVVSNGLTVVSLIALFVGIFLIFAQPSQSFLNSHKPSLSVDALTGNHFYGPENAQVTVVEFSDFQCSDCKQAQEVLTELRSQYPDRLRFVFHHFPLTATYSHTLQASNAAEAAAVQGKFWEFASLLFEQQNTWSNVSDPSDLFIAYAQQVETSNLSQFRDDVHRMVYRQIVLGDLALGNRLGISEAPTFFINDQKVPLPGLQLAVERILSKPR